MAKTLHQTPRVLFVTDTAMKACRDKQAGILRYAHLHGPWDIQTLEYHTHASRLGDLVNWRPDGIILEPVKEAVMRQVSRKRIPCVWLEGGVSGNDKRPSVTHDPKPIAEAAADHLLALRLPHFAFVGSIPDSFWSQWRAEIFAARVAAATGATCHHYTPIHPEDWGLEQRHLQAWLRQLPKPCGLMVAHDPRAKQVLDTCLEAGIRVPGEIAVVSVDDDPAICERTTPTLTSVAPDFEGGGYLAAELLDGLMRSSKVLKCESSKVPSPPAPSGAESCGNFRTLELPNFRTVYGIKGIVPRLSSLHLGRASGLISTALEYIRLNAHNGIGVPDVVAHLNVSRRYVEHLFRTVLRRSVLDEIQNRRLERVCALLRETRLPIGEISESCGYDGPRLKVLFKQHFGMTMRDYRNDRGTSS